MQHNESVISNFFSGGGGDLWASGTAAGDQVYSNANASSSWCEVTGHSGYNLLRLQCTSECAEYSGPAGGGGSVILAGCDSSKLAQNWGGNAGTATTIWNQYPPGCLSSNKGTEEPVYMVEPSGGCTGAGGQKWTGYP